MYTVSTKRKTAFFIILKKCEHNHIAFDCVYIFLKCIKKKLKKKVNSAPWSEHGSQISSDAGKKILSTSKKKKLSIIKKKNYQRPGFGIYTQRNLIKSTRNQIVFTMHRLIWNQSDVHFNQSENGKCNQISF